MYLLIMHPNAPSFKRIHLNRLDDEITGMIACRSAAIDANYKYGPVILDAE